jgi:hypothetical protein
MREFTLIGIGVLLNRYRLSAPTHKRHLFGIIPCRPMPCQFAASVDLRIAATSLALMAAALLFHPARINVSTSAIC